MRRTIAAAGAAAAAVLVVGATFAPRAGAATPPNTNAVNALKYLYGQEGTDGSIASAAGATEDTIIGTADSGFDPATLTKAGGTSAYAYLAGLVSGGKVTTAGATAKLVLAWVAAGKPSAIDGNALLTKLDAAASGGGFLQPNGAFHATDAAVETGNVFSQALGVLANVAAGHALPANATGWLVCAHRSDGGFGYAITDTAAAPPTSCGDTSSDTNDTAIAIQALDAAKVKTADAGATAYLHAAQQADGGFGFDAGGPSDPDSDATVIQAIVALGEDPTAGAWTKGGKTPMSSLLTFETPGGSGAYQFPGNKAPDAFTTSEVPAALALTPAGAETAFTKGSSPLTAVAAPSATPTPVVTPTGSVAPGISVPVPTSSVSGIVTSPIGAPNTGGAEADPGYGAGQAAVVVECGLLLFVAAALMSRGPRARRRR